MPNIGPVEIIVILLILLVVFGPKRIPELGRSVGQGMRNFKDSVTGRDRGDERGLEARTTTPRPADRRPARLAPRARYSREARGQAEAGRTRRAAEPRRAPRRAALAPHSV